MTSSAVFYLTVLFVGFLTMTPSVIALLLLPVSRQLCQACRQLHMVSSSEESRRQLVSKGMNLFRQGDINGSIDLFDSAEAADKSLRPFLWQRGISYYYADRFQEGSDQFRYDVRVNPLVREKHSLSSLLMVCVFFPTKMHAVGKDVEEIVWDIACLSRLNPQNVPPPDMMSLPQGRTDRRKIMVSHSSVFSLLFLGRLQTLFVASSFRCSPLCTPCFVGRQLSTISLLLVIAAGKLKLFLFRMSLKETASPTQ